MQARCPGAAAKLETRNEALINPLKFGRPSLIRNLMKPAAFPHRVENSSLEVDAT